VRLRRVTPASSMNVICGRVAYAPTNSGTKLGSGRSPVNAKRATANLLPKLRNRKNGRGRGSMFVVRASDGTESSTMDYAGALKFLGLSESASSEDMVKAKNQMISRYENQEDKLQKVRDLPSRVTNNTPQIIGSTSVVAAASAFEAAWIPVSIAESYFKRILSYVSSLHVQVEAAYDVVLMRSLMKRSQGEVSDNRVKYADVLSPGATVKQKLPPWARDLTTKLPPRPAFETPDNETLTQCGIALGVLTALTLAQGCSQVSFSSSHLKPSPKVHHPPAHSNISFPLRVTQPPGVDNPPGLQLSLALLGSVWLLRKKNLTLSRSISLALLGLSAGAFVGGAVQGWLRVDIVPLGALSSPSALVSEFGLLGIFAASAFLY